MQSVERFFLQNKIANFVISESRSQIYLGYAEREQNLDKNLWESNRLLTIDKTIFQISTFTFQIFFVPLQKTIH